MTKNLLVELGLEEMPAYVVTPSMEQLRERMIAFLTENRLPFEGIEMFSTPRRLAVRVLGLADVQDDLTEDFKGPSKKIALDDQGNFTKAAQGFVRGKGLSLEDIRFEEIKGEEYLYVTKHEKGQKAKDVLANLPQAVLEAMTFPVNMHWANHTFEYIRPVHTLVVLLGDDLLDMEFFSVSSGRLSRGHRFLGQDAMITSADSYEDDLRQQFVLADARERENVIVEQIRRLEEEHGVSVEIDEDLLNEVLNLVEYPTAFMGRFDDKYLEVPEEVLVTSMKNHQRYFVVRDQDGKLLPAFISVRNGNEAHITNVIKGNEKVLLARLEDAEFFWKEDQKLVIEDLVSKLSQVTFHEKIGSLADHMARTKEIAQVLAPLAGLTDDELADVSRAATIYKFDLLTGMVGEFDELQGLMGEKYAKLAGEKASVATAIREHYLPTSSEGELPDTSVGAVLALADKLDTLLSFFSVGLIPSGSNDPYALRRATQGIVKILDKFGWSIDLLSLVNSLYHLELTALSYDHQADVVAFIRARVDKMLADQKVAKDIRQAVLNSPRFIVRERVDVAMALVELAKTTEYKEAVESLARSFNLAEKADSDSEVDNRLFENDYEKDLYQAILDLVITEDVKESLEKVFALRPVITNFFDNTMVMSDDAQVKNNRLALLNLLVKKAEQLAIFNQLETK